MWNRVKPDISKRVVNNYNRNFNNRSVILKGVKLLEYYAEGRISQQSKTNLQKTANC